MRRFTKVFAIFAVFVAISVPPAIALLRAAPVGDPGAPPVAPIGDPFPDLPPLSDLARLPSAEIAENWSKLQRAVMNEAQAGMDDPTLPRQLQSRYEDIVVEVGKRMSWSNYIIGAHDITQPERMRRHFLQYLKVINIDAYNTGVWPPPVPFEMIPEKKP
jgi:hypothetical protein